MTQLHGRRDCQGGRVGREIGIEWRGLVWGAEEQEGDLDAGMGMRCGPAVAALVSKAFFRDCLGVEGQREQRKGLCAVAAGLLMPFSSWNGAELAPHPQ